MDVLLLDKTGTITLGNRQASNSCLPRGVTEAELADAAQLASLADETPEGRSIVVLAKEKFGLRERNIHDTGRDLRAVHRADAHERRRTSDKATPDPQRRGRRHPQLRHSLGGNFPAEVNAIVDSISRRGSTPLVVADGREGAGRDRAQGHRQGRHQGTLRRTAPHGHQDHHDHRRQPPYRRGHRRRSRRGRLPGRGHAGSQAEADPRASGARPAGGDDRRRHQRRAGAGAGRRGGGDEHRHAGGQGSGQHGGPGFQPDQADRDRGDRQADADDARFADHLQHRQRRVQVFRHHPGGLRLPPIRRWARST